MYICTNSGISISVGSWLKNVVFVHLCPCSATHIRPVATSSHQRVCHVSHLLSLLQQT